MKTRSTLLLLLLTAACLVQSCSKSKQLNTGTDLTMVKLTSGSSVWYSYYERDASGKVISMTDSAKSIVLNTSFEYATNGKLNKVTTVDQTSGQTTLAFSFEYDANARIIKRHMIVSGSLGDDDYSTYTYDGTGHLVLDSQFSKSGGSTYQPIIVIKYMYTGENVTSSEAYQLVSGTLQLTNQLKFEYDDKLNPYKKMDNYYFYTETGSVGYDGGSMGQNNMIKEYLAKGSGDYQLNRAFSYEYNDSNYPVKLKTDFNSSGGGLSTLDFVYHP